MKTKSPIPSLSLIAAAVICAAAPQLHADIVSFGFSGFISHVANPSNALPANLTVGLPFTGVFTYDTSKVALGGDTDPNPAVGDYYFHTNGGFWLQVTVAGHTVATVQPVAGDPYATIGIHNYSGSDATFAAGAAAPTIRLDGGPLPGVFTSSGFSLYLFDKSGTAFTNDLLPTVPPLLSAFPNNHRFELNAFTAQGWTFDLMGTLTNISAQYQPALAIRRAAGINAVLAWPLAARGFTLQSSTNLPAANWQPVPGSVVDVVAEHTVTVPLDQPATFYRLWK